jgi:hypothetical protein
VVFSYRQVLTNGIKINNGLQGDAFLLPLLVPSVAVLTFASISQPKLGLAMTPFLPAMEKLWDSDGVFIVFIIRDLLVITAGRTRRVVSIFIFTPAIMIRAHSPQRLSTGGGSSLSDSAGELPSELSVEGSQECLPHYGLHQHCRVRSQ